MCPVGRTQGIALSLDDFDSLERQFITGYEARIAGLPEFIRGFGHVKELNLAAVRRREAELLGRFASGDRQVVRIQEAKGAVERVE